MKKLREMTHRERTVLKACNDGWWMSGRYVASFDNHERTFEADSTPILFNDVYKWYQSHEEHHGGARVLVRCVQPL